MTEVLCPVGLMSGGLMLQHPKIHVRMPLEISQLSLPFLRIVEISGLWKIDYSYFGIKLMNCENFFLNIKYLAYL